MSKAICHSIEKAQTMGIRFKYDAAAVSLPSTNSSGSKYGQQLVLQQQQQRYAAQQAGYNRMFDAYKQQQQNDFIAARDKAQNQFQVARDKAQNQFVTDRDKAQNQFVTDRDKAQNQFVTDRDKAQFDQQQKLLDQQRQQKFMDDARKQTSGMIMQDIQNGLYDTATARDLQQNLIAESEALGNDQYDATQRAELLQKIRAKRELLVSSRMEKPPAPTPMSADDAFKADPKVRDKYMKDAKSMVLEKPGEDGTVIKQPMTEELWNQAAALARKLYEKDYGIGTPTPAQEVPGMEQAPKQGQMPATSPTIQPATLPATGPIQSQLPPEQVAKSWIDPSPTQPASSQASQPSSVQNQVQGSSVKLGDASNYPWLKQPGQLMSENKTSQASSPITIETASSAAKQYETASQQLQTLQSQAAAMDAKIQSLQGRTGRSGVRSTQTNQEIAKLKKERQQLNLGIRSAQNTMQASDKFVRGYYDQEVAKQPAVQALAKAGKRPQDFAQAEFQLKNLRMQYPDMSTMPEEAKKQLKEAMAVIQAGR